MDVIISQRILTEVLKYMFYAHNFDLILLILIL